MSDPTVSLAAPTTQRTAGTPAALRDPVREYIGDFAGQLAVMARDAGDEALADSLEAAETLALRPLARPVVIAAPLKRRA
jgi:hypothetical protein